MHRVPVVKHRPLDGVQLDAAYREGKVPVIQLVYDGTVPLTSKSLCRMASACRLRTEE